MDSFGYGSSPKWSPLIRWILERICTIDRNDFCLIHFESEEFNTKVEKDYDDFLTIKVKLKLIDEHVTVMVLYLDRTYSFSNSQNFEIPLQNCIFLKKKIEKFEIIRCYSNEFKIIPINSNKFGWIQNNSDYFKRILIGSD